MKIIILFTGALMLLFSGCRTSMESAETAAIRKDLPKGYRKCIAAPYLKEKIQLDGKLDENVWKKAEFFDDFVLHRRLTPAPVRTEVRMFHDDEFLYIGMKCFEKKENIKPVPENGYLWSGDCVELFLGNMEPEPNLYQFCWTAGEGRYGVNDFWDSKSFITENHWSSETRIKLSFLKPDNCSLSIHIARWSRNAKKGYYTIWNYVGHDFQTLPRYAELILGSYDLAAKTKFRYYSDKKLTRTDYEKLSYERTIPAEKLAYGPWLFAASETEMNIGWYNEGRSGSALEYRKKGEKRFKKIISHKHEECADSDRRIHKIQLKNLEKGTTYEYRIINTGRKTEIYPGKETFYTFTTHGKKDLTMGIFSDVHNEGYALHPLLNNKKLMDSCDILVNVGDMLSNSTGVHSVISGYLDAQLPFASKKPILNFRGNHEYVGISPSTFFEVFGTPDFKGYSMNRFGDICIIGMDTWNSKQKTWLKQAVKTPVFQTAKHRIMFAHFPPLHANATYTKTILKDLDGIFTGKNPSERLDLLVAGHIHKGCFTPKNSGLTTTLPPNSKVYKTVKVPFPVLVNEGNRSTRQNVMTIVEVKGDSIVAKLIRLDGTVSKEYKIK